VEQPKQLKPAVPPLERNGREVKRFLKALRVVGLQGQIAVGRSCQDPTKDTDNSPSEVVRIEIVAENHYRVERADGSAFDLSNCGVVALFEIHPSETPLTQPEIERLGKQMFAQSIGREFPADKKADVVALTARGEKAGQMAGVQKEIDKQAEMHRRQKMSDELNGLRDIDGRTLSQGELDAEPANVKTSGIILSDDEPPVPAGSGLASL